MRSQTKASSAGSISGSGSDHGSNRRIPVAFLGALVLAITVSLGATSAIADAPPSVTINTPTEVSYASAQVSGTVDPEGGPSSTVWAFEFSTDPENPASWERAWSATGEISGAEAEASNPIAVGGTLYVAPGAAGVEYSVRLVAENEESANRSQTGPPYLSFTTLAVPPPAVTIDAPSDVAATSAHFSGTINPGNTDPIFQTNWHFECTPQCPGLGESYGLVGTSPQPVSVDARGLQPNTSYEVSLSAANGTGVEVKAGPKSFTTPAEAPFASTIAATRADGGTSATVGGTINPRNSASTYWIEYGTSDSYGQSAPPSKDAGVGSGGQTIAVSQQLSGLTPATTYHYRAVAKNATGTTVGQDLTFKTPPATAPPAASCPNQALRVGPSAALPSCRAYEQISPPSKNESDVEESTFPGNGGHVLYRASGAYAGATRGGINGYLATRTEDGWQSKSLTPALPSSVPQSVVPPNISVSADGSLTLVVTADPLVPASATKKEERNDFLIGPDGSPDWISKPTASFPETNPSPALNNVGATADFSHILFTKPKKIVAAAAGLEEHAFGLYEWTGGVLRLVNVDSAGALINPYGANFGARNNASTAHAMSRDGERIFFTTPGSEEYVPPPFDVRKIYLRESGQTTTEISASQCTQPSCQGPERDAEYQGASADGSVAFFTSRAQLTNDATPGGGLYRYDVSDGKLTLLTPDAADPAGAAVEGLVANSDDGSLVYFVAQGKLATGATLGADNLYLYDATTDATTFITAFNPSDFLIWEGGSEKRLAVVTPSGHNLAFQTATPLSAGYDNAGHSELYRYDAPTKELTCVSCLPVGVAAQSDVSFTEGAGAQERHNVSDDGSYIFFQTRARLVSGDKNEKLDVYEWHDGDVSLISSGTSTADSPFGSATPSGKDVTFTTWQSLVSSDTDGHADLYDARVDGGFSQPSISLTPPCSEAGCRGSGTADAASPSPGSATFTAPDAAAGKGSATFRVDQISVGQAKTWARTGLLSLRVKVPGAGRVGVVVRGRLDGRSTIVARASRSARRGGTVTLALRLSKGARSYLERHGRLPLTVAVTYSHAKVTKHAQVTLRAGRSKSVSSRGHR